VVVRDDASEANAQHEAFEASLRTMLALESSRLRDARAEVRLPAQTSEHARPHAKRKRGATRQRGLGRLCALVRR
jgi:hypothetical protein